MMVSYCLLIALQISYYAYTLSSLDRFEPEFRLRRPSVYESQRLSRPIGVGTTSTQLMVVDRSSWLFLLDYTIVKEVPGSIWSAFQIRPLSFGYWSGRGEPRQQVDDLNTSYFHEFTQHQQLDDTSSLLFHSNLYTT
jgi:hypothetical protein